MSFAPLHVHSAFSFLDGASSVDALVLRAAELGLPALALTDTGSVTGMVSLTRKCRKAGIKPLGGCEVVVAGLGRLTLLADGPTGWASLCRLLTVAALRDVKRETVKGGAVAVTWEDLEAGREGLVCLSGSARHGRIPALVRRRQYAQAKDLAVRCRALFGVGNYFLEVTRTLTDGEDRVCEALLALADTLGVPAVATNPVHHAVKMGLPAHETLCRIRLGLAPDRQSADLPYNGEGYLKSAEAMQRLFMGRPDALENAARLADRLAPPLDPTVHHLPRFPALPVGESAFSYLSALTWQGARTRYEKRVNDGVKARLVHELETVRDLGFCDYFLVCWDVCRQARQRNIGYGLRGSAVGSAVAHCLGMSEHDPIAHNISFERFLSRGRAKPPDIDIDFRHDLRDSMMTYVRDTYGHDKVANVSNYVTFRARSLLRDIGKALGFDTLDVERLRELLGWSQGDDLAEETQKTPELRALGIDAAQYADLFALCAQLSGLPRHLRTHSSGIVVSDVPLAGVCPVGWAAKGVTVAALDKDDVEAEGIGLLKMDQLSLRALTAIDLTVGRLVVRDPLFDYAGRDREDGDTLAMIRAAETVGCFQLESPAQMALQWRLKADKFEDLVASVALIRPGPLQGKTVEPYIRRRHGWEPVTYPLPELEQVLKETYGRILFQDQVLDVARAVGDLSPDEADQFQRAITHARNEEEMARLGLSLYERAKAKGMTKKAFSRLWKQIQGFSRYGFCHGHAVAFADHAQGTAWLLRHHPAEFLAATLSVEPCGFWPVSTVVAEAQRRGVAVYGPCINRSAGETWGVEEAPTPSPSLDPAMEALRLGAASGRGQQERETGAAIRCSLAYVREVRRAAALIQGEREARGAFVSLVDVCRRCAFLSREQLEWLALAGALDGLSPSRRETLWSLPALHTGYGDTQKAYRRREVDGQMAAAMEVPPLLPRGLADFTRSERFHRQWQALGFSPEGHPILSLREDLTAQGVGTCGSLRQATPGAAVTIAGLVIRPHRPPAAGGTVFFTLEDETGMAHVTVFPSVYETCGAAIYGHAALVVIGTAQKRGGGVLLVAQAVRAVI